MKYINLRSECPEKYTFVCLLGLTPLAMPHSCGFQIPQLKFKIE